MYCSHAMTWTVAAPAQSPIIGTRYGLRSSALIARRSSIARWPSGTRRTCRDGCGRTAVPRPYQGWLAGPTVNSLMVVSSGWSIANATTLAIRSGEIPYRSYNFAMPSAVSL